MLTYVWVPLVGSPVPTVPSATVLPPAVEALSAYNRPPKIPTKRMLFGAATSWVVAPVPPNGTYRTPPDEPLELPLSQNADPSTETVLRKSDPLKPSLIRVEVS